MLKNVRTIPKNERGRYEDRDVWEKSSEVTSFNLYEQSWTDLQAADLAHHFKSEADFKEKQAAYHQKQNEKEQVK